MKPLGMLTFYALTPLHMGAGSSLSYVDLPIQRENYTGFPVLWASGIKGAMREWFERKEKEFIDEVFGPKPKPGEGEDLRGSLISITDGRLLLYPVRSGRGVFAWITCPFVLKRLSEDLKLLGEEVSELSSVDVKHEEAFILEDSSVVIDNEKVILEEFLFVGKEFSEKHKQFLNDGLLNKLKGALPESMKEVLESHLVIVHDDVFKDLVTYTTEVRTRIRIDQTTGTVAEGALFTEEFVPSEAIFYSLLFWIDRNNKEEELRNKFLEAIKSVNYLFLGGDETIGKGLVKVSLLFSEGGEVDGSQKPN